MSHLWENEKEKEKGRKEKGIEKEWRDGRKEEGIKKERRTEQKERKEEKKKTKKSLLLALNWSGQFCWSSCL